MTLVELMIASTISLVALSAVITVYSATARHSTRQLQQAHLHQQLNGLMHLVSSDLRRAGYRHFSPGLVNPANNPFQNPVNRVRTGFYAGEHRNSCILFAYDLDQDGLAGVGRCDDGNCEPLTDDDNVEQFGFRLRGTGIQSRFGGSRFDCNHGYWQTVNDPDIEITRLEFQPRFRCLNLDDRNSACTPDSAQLVQGGIGIRISAQLKNRAATALTLDNWVRVRNDRLVAGSQGAD